MLTPEQMEEAVEAAPTCEQVRDLLDYDPNSGRLLWRRDHGWRRPGDQAGWVNAYGYINVKIGKRTYRAHRIIWLGGRT